MITGKNGGSRIRRAAWRHTLMGFSFALFARAPLIVGGDDLIFERNSFNDFDGECRSLLRSAWGSSSARRRGIRAVHDSSSCPSLKRVSTSGRALLIASNLVPTGPRSPCWDSDLAHAAERACGADWRSEFRSDQWHPHAEGRAYVPDYYVYVQATLLFLVVTGLLLLV